MPNKNYTGLKSTGAVDDLVSGVCKLDGDKLAEIQDENKLQTETIYTLQFNASVNENEEAKQRAIHWINEIAKAYGLESGSNAEFYKEKQEGKHEFFTVPAVNSRMMTFHTVRSAIRASDRLKLPHIIFELALSEVSYTAQQKDEYAALVKAAHISLGIKNRKIYLQADHYQLNPDKYKEDSEAEVKRIQDAIVKAIENGVYNIDLDCSKFETAVLDKSDEENQAENARLTAELLKFVRSYEKEHDLPCQISVGGEVGEVGGENTRYPQVNAYLELLAKEAGDLKGLDKVSINVGSAHGGVLGPDGKPLESVPLDFQAHHDLYMLGKDPLNPDKHVLTVQHGASTLPKHYFPLFPAMHVAEVHLATGFQNVVWEVLEKEDNELHKKLKDLTFEKFADKIAKHTTEAVGFMKERKRVTEFVKRDLLMTDVIEAVEKALEQEFTDLFYSLYNILLPKGGEVVEGDRGD